MSRKFLIASALASILVLPSVTQAESYGHLSDAEIAHVAYTADNIDIRYAHLALALSSNPKVHEFANTMIRDHSIVNEQALALLQRLGVTPKDNDLSRQLVTQSEKIIAEMAALTGPAFDRYYADNELAYHEAVNGLVEGQFIPNVDNAEFKALLEQALVIFKGHQHSAHDTVATVAR